MPKLLYIDTSGTESLIMLLHDSIVMSLRSNVLQNEHAKYINIHIAEILSETQCSWNQIDAVCVLNGPGSYTGLRIGLASAKGFCFAQNLPLILINHLDLLQDSCADTQQNMACILKARENEFFIKIYDTTGAVLMETELCNKEEILLLKEKYQFNMYSSDEKINSDFDFLEVIKPQKEEISQICLKYFFDKKFSDLRHSEPFYLKNVHINKINKL